MVDTSGSMAREERLELVKDALADPRDRLDPDDRVAIVTFGDDAGIVLEPTPARTTARSSTRSTASSRAARRTSRRAFGWATSSPARR